MPVAFPQATFALSSACAFLGVILCLHSTPALAKDNPTVAIVGIHDASLDVVEQHEAIETLADIVMQDKRFDVVRPADLARTISGREELIISEAYLTTGQRLLEDGRTLHDQAQFEQAVPVLEQAVDGLIQAMPAADATRELWESYLYLGAAHQALGHDSKAVTVWKAAVALNPERQPDRARIPPGIVQGYELAKAKAIATTGTLTVKAPGAKQVFVNGIDRGPAPLKLEDMPVGTVHVRVRGDGGAYAYKQGEVFENTMSTVDLELGQPILPIAGETRFSRIRATTDLYKAIGKEAPVNLILVVGGRDGKASVQLYAPPADAFSNAVEITYTGDTVGEIAAALPGLLEAVSESGSIPSIATTATAAPLDPADNSMLGDLLLDPKPFTPMVPGGTRKNRGVLIAGTAGAVVLGGIVTGVVLASQGDGNRGTIVIGPFP